MILELASEPRTTYVGVLTLFKLISSCCPVSSPSRFSVCAETGTVILCIHGAHGFKMRFCAFALLHTACRSCYEVMSF